MKLKYPIITLIFRDQNYDLMDLPELIDEALQLTTRNKLVEVYEERFTIFGDLHGDFDTLELLIKHAHKPYIFLGDYADRGEKQIEVYELLLTEYIEGNAILIRGNHESDECYPHDFPYHLYANYREEGEEIYNRFKSFWEDLPLSAITSDLWLVHGGIPVGYDDIDIINVIRRPNDDVKIQMLWNDPCDDDESQFNFKRGIGILFGKNDTKRFIESLDVKCIVRSHEPYKILRVEQDGMVVTVGSTAKPYGLSQASIIVMKDESFRDGFDLIKKFGHVFDINLINKY